MYPVFVLRIRRRRGRGRGRRRGRIGCFVTVIVIAIVVLVLALAVVLVFRKYIELEILGSGKGQPFVVHGEYLVVRHDARIVQEHDGLAMARVAFLDGLVGWILDGALRVSGPGAHDTGGSHERQFDAPETTHGKGTDSKGRRGIPFGCNCVARVAGVAAGADATASATTGATTGAIVFEIVHREWIDAHYLCVARVAGSRQWMVGVHNDCIVRDVQDIDPDSPLEIERRVGDNLVNVLDLFEVRLGDLDHHIGIVPPKPGIHGNVPARITLGHSLQQFVQAGEVVSPSQHERYLPGRIEQVFGHESVLRCEFEFHGYNVADGGSCFGRCRC
mmetsp:Transcript_6086/g.14138  ORF Transcript_6086/g.14138 Transcript_6086/m.14138 type:complete len:332 (+) Transcript_6086:357-1352(+)